MILPLSCILLGNRLLNYSERCKIVSPYRLWLLLKLIHPTVLFDLSTELFPLKRLIHILCWSSTQTCIHHYNYTYLARCIVHLCTVHCKLDCMIGHCLHSLNYIRKHSVLNIFHFHKFHHKLVDIRLLSHSMRIQHCMCIVPVLYIHHFDNFHSVAHN